MTRDVARHGIDLTLNTDDPPYAVYDFETVIRMSKKGCIEVVSFCVQFDALLFINETSHFLSPTAFDIYCHIRF